MLFSDLFLSKVNSGLRHKEKQSKLGSFRGLENIGSETRILGLGCSRVHPRWKSSAINVSYSDYKQTLISQSVNLVQSNISASNFCSVLVFFLKRFFLVFLRYYKSINAWFHWTSEVPKKDVEAYLGRYQTSMMEIFAW